MIEVAPGIRVVPVRTPTLPPATHTNTYVVGEGALTVFDPASPWVEEQARLAAALGERVARGERVERIVLTHHHADHVSGALDLRKRFGAPIVAHPDNVPWLPRIDLDAVLGEGPLACGGRSLVATHTPGHAPGHLVFQDVDSGAVVAGDMVAGIGTIAISPEDGDLGQYLDSLARMRRLAATVLLPSHGPPLAQADAVLAFYIAHRHQRSDQVLGALDRLGASSPDDLVPVVYPELDAAARPVAAGQLESHLRWLELHGLVEKLADRLWGRI